MTSGLAVQTFGHPVTFEIESLASCTQVGNITTLILFPLDRRQTCVGTFTISHIKLLF